MQRSLRRNAVYLFVLVMLLPVLALRDFTPDNELRYLSIADEALRDGHLFAFSNHGVPYADKPPLYLWIVMLGKWLWGSHEMWFLSLASVLPALGVVRIMDVWTRREYATEAGRSAARWMLFTTAYFLGSAVVLRMDMLMCLFIVLALRTFYMWSQAGRRAAPLHKWLFPLYVFLALFTKGPVGVLVPLLGTVAYLVGARRWREIGRYWGWRTWGVLLALCALWFGAVYADGGAAYLHNLLFHQTLDRAVNSFHHSRPFYYYALSLWYVAAPWSVLLCAMAVAAWRRGWVRTDLQRLFMAVCVCTFVMLSCFSSKVDVYLLPLLPFALSLGGVWMERCGNARWARVVVAVVPGAVWMLALPAVAVAWAVPSLGLSPFLSPCLVVAAAVLTATGARGMWQALRRRALASAVRTMAAGVLCALFVAAWELPRLNDYVGYGNVCREARQVAAAHGVADYATWRMRRAENMEVYLHRAVPELSDSVLLTGAQKETVVILRNKYWERSPELRRQSRLSVVRSAGPYSVAVLPAARPVPGGGSRQPR